MSLSIRPVLFSSKHPSGSPSIQNARPVWNELSRASSDNPLPVIYNNKPYHVVSARKNVTLTDTNEKFPYMLWLKPVFQVFPSTPIVTQLTGNSEEDVLKHLRV